MYGVYYFIYNTTIAFLIAHYDIIVHYERNGADIPHQLIRETGARSLSTFSSISP